MVWSICTQPHGLDASLETLQVASGLLTASFSRGCVQNQLVQGGGVHLHTTHLENAAMRPFQASARGVQPRIQRFGRQPGSKPRRGAQDRPGGSRSEAKCGWSDRITPFCGSVPLNIVVTSTFRLTT